MNEIVSFPIDIPPVVPDDWNRWWTLWSKESVTLTKETRNHNFSQACWKGFNVYVKHGIDTSRYDTYNVPNVNCPELFKSFFDTIDKFPLELHMMRIVSSFANVSPHYDLPKDSKENVSIRSLMHDNNIFPNFYYLIKNKKKYQQLPIETNTWAYYDKKVKHGSNFYQGYNKILIMYFGITKHTLIKDYQNVAQQKYEKCIVYDN